jgi:WD40 repeat protein
LRPSLDPDLECICLKCLEKDPKDRYGNAASLATDLRRYCDGMPIVARKIGWIRRTAKLARRHPVVSAQLALIAFVAIAFVATVVSYNVRLERTLKKETRAAYAMELQLAASVAPDNPGEALELLEHDRFESLHDFCWRHLLQSCKRGIHDWDNQDAVFAIAASPDSKTFATGDQRGTVRVWSIDDRQPRRVFGNAHAGKITDMAFSPDGQCLATSSEDCTTKLWTWPDLHPVLTLQGETSFNGLAFSPDGECLAAAGACSPEEAVSDGKAALGGTIHVWKMPSGEQEVVLPAHKESVFRVSFSSDGKHLASVSPEGLLCLWDVGSWNHTEHPGFGVAAAFHPKESARLAVSDMYQKVRVERITADERLDAGSPVCSSPATVSSLAFSPKGDYLAAGSYDGTTYVWNEASGAVMRLAMKESRVTAVGFLGPDRLVTGSHEGRIQCWDLRNCSRPDQWQAHPGRAIDGLIVLPGGRLVTSGADGFICLWDLRNGNCLQRCQRSGTSAVGVAGAANQKLLVWDDGGVIHRGFFDKDHRLVQERALSEPTFPRGLTPLRTGDRIVVADFDGLHVLGADGHQTTLECEEEAICLAASPTEDLLAVAGQNGGVWLDRLDGKRRRLLASPGAAVRCMAFSANGTRLAIGMNDGGVLFHDVASGVCTMTLRGHSEAINAIAFSADGRTVATGGANGNVRLWDPVGGEERMLLRGSSSIQNLCFSPEGTALVAGAVDGHVRVWNAVD